MLNFFKKAFINFGNLIKTRCAYILSIFFIWIVPIQLLNEYVGELAEVNVAFKITFIGCLTILVVFLALRKKIYALIHKRPHGLTRGVLLCLHKGVTYGLVLAIMWALNNFSIKFYRWWLLCGISIAIGLILILVDEWKCAKEVKKQKEVEKDERN